MSNAIFSHKTTFAFAYRSSIQLRAMQAGPIRGIPTAHILKYYFGLTKTG